MTNAGTRVEVTAGSRPSTIWIGNGISERLPELLDAAGTGKAAIHRYDGDQVGRVFMSVVLRYKGGNLGHRSLSNSFNSLNSLKERADVAVGPGGLARHALSPPGSASLRA